MRELVIFGAGSVAEAVHWCLAEEGGRSVAAFAVDAEFRKADQVLGVPVVDFETIQQTHPPDRYEMFVAVGYAQVNKFRAAKCAQAQAKGYALASHVSPRAMVWPGLNVQPNTLIMEANVIQPYVTVGRNVIMWSGNHVGHHSAVEEDCFIASHAVISGNCRIGQGTFIGVNATLRDGISIGRHNVIGAAALILADTPDNGVFIGAATEMSRVPSNRLRGI
ncbi:MAG TPA: acetyltransferase [Caulobacteraceae bacterium]|nr:acetyltransferase [Caulobacteraceae bacterium]